MSADVERLLQHLATAPAVLVQVHATQGSAPRDAGTWMAVLAGEVIGTIGGGHLEFQAVDRARALLQSAPSPGDPLSKELSGAPEAQRVALGPSLGQCCGGVVHLQYERVSARDIPAMHQRLNAGQMPVALFGGGHVGHALAEVLARLPVALHWIDSRDGIFPVQPAGNVLCEHSEPVQDAVKDVAAGARVLIMSFSHAEDLDILAQCLLRQRTRGDLPYIGLIGSKTKWATFRRRLEARGFSAEELAHVTCPIGVPGISGKEPEVIAVAVAAQLLQAR
jgi:xanthine dehydrogenase accessory factor